MRRLHLDQPVTVTLDEEPRPIACRVLDVQGAVSRLAYSEEISPRAVGRLVRGCSGYLVFDEFGMPVGLRVAVRASPPNLDVAVMDGVTMPERRGRERVKFTTPVRIISPHPDEHVQPAAVTQTINLSERGALLEHHPALDRDQPFALEFSFGDDPRPVTAQAHVARHLPDAVGVVFESISADDETRLHQYLTGIRHQRGRRLRRAS